MLGLGPQEEDGANGTAPYVAVIVLRTDTRGRKPDSSRQRPGGCGSAPRPEVPAEHQRCQHLLGLVQKPTETHGPGQQASSCGPPGPEGSDG